MEGDRAHSRQTVVSADGRREFACFPAAILAFIVNDDDEFLLLSHPARRGAWEIVSGAINDGESPVDALLREVSEEAGPQLHIRPVAGVHTFLYRFDAAIPAMFSIAYVATYVSGDVVPGSDLAMSEVRWAGLHEIEGEQLTVILPAQTWLFRRALAVHRLFRDEQVDLEPWETSVPRVGSGAGRALTAILFSDIVDSTATAVTMGDVAWLDRLQQHDRLAHGVVAGCSGRIVKHTGDGLLALFASTGDAVAAGAGLQRETAKIGMSVRVGVHVGEVEILANDVFGQAVVVASRLCDAASAGELLVSQTAAALLVGSDVQLQTSRMVQMKGIGDRLAFVAQTSA